MENSINCKSDFPSDVIAIAQRYLIWHFENFVPVNVVETDGSAAPEIKCPLIGN